MNDRDSFLHLIRNDAEAQKLLQDVVVERRRLRIAKRRSTTKQWQARLNRCGEEKRGYYIWVTKDTKCKNE